MEKADALGWQSDIPVVRSVTLPPDPHVMDAIGGNHRLETAVADLVDNAIDAESTAVLIRFVVLDGRVQSFYVVDNGRGMDDTQIDGAMTVGGVREYGDNELGHFGLGLKAASFSQADSLTVVSRAAAGSGVGRRWLTRKASASFECEVVDERFCVTELGRTWSGLDTNDHGTVIRWDTVRGFPGSRDAAVTSRFLQDAVMRLRQHLGMVFHRFLEHERVRITLDTEDVSTRTVGPPFEVQSLDPFGYARTGATGYPLQLGTTVDGTRLTLRAHVWPGRSQQPQFRLRGDSPERYQGFYFYRRDRLLQAGGWNGTEVQRRDLQLARVAIDLSEAHVGSPVFRMNPEKSRIECGPEFGPAIDRAKARTGTTFREYLEEARQAFKRANQRTRSRAPVVEFGRGVPPRVRRAISRELTFVPGYGPVDFRWTSFRDDTFFEVDRDDNTVWLNSRYRAAATGSPQGSFNDAPLVKVLLFLLVENLFHGSYWGTKDRDNVQLWQALLTAAVKEQVL